MSAHEVAMLILIGLMAGFTSGLLGVGGAIIMVPALILLMGLSQHNAQGTSLAVLLFPIGILAVINYHRAGHVNLLYALALMVTFVVGSYFGSLLSIHLSGRTLRVIFGVFTLLLSLKLILSK